MAGLFAPKWLTFLVTMAAANGLVSLGIVGLMRGGVVPFGQGMMLALGGYAAALSFNQLGITDVLLLALGGGVVAALVAAPFAPLLSRYRGIFFAMLTLALSMVLYGLLMKLTILGGSDGFNVGRPTLLGQKLPDSHSRLHHVRGDGGAGHGDGAAGARLLRQHARPGDAGGARKRTAGRIPRRLGAPGDDDQLHPGRLLRRLGGALAVMSLGHIEPNFSFWTTSGEFVFVAILAGWQSVAAVFVASTVLEVVRCFSSAYFPNTWQLVLGLFLLFVIRFLPKGIGSLWMRGNTTMSNRAGGQRPGEALRRGGGRVGRSTSASPPANASA